MIFPSNPAGLPCLLQNPYCEWLLTGTAGHFWLFKNMLLLKSKFMSTFMYQDSKRDGLDFSYQKGQTCLLPLFWPFPICQTLFCQEAVEQYLVSISFPICAPQTCLSSKRQMGLKTPSWRGIKKRRVRQKWGENEIFKGEIIRLEMHRKTELLMLMTQWSREGWGTALYRTLESQNEFRVIPVPQRPWDNALPVGKTFINAPWPFPVLKPHSEL